MLPRAVSSAEREKIQQRNKQYNGLSFSQRVSGGRLGFSMRPDKYEKYQSRSSRVTPARRRATLIRSGMVLTLIILTILFFIPSLRPSSILSILTLGLLSNDGGEAFQIETVRYYDLSHVSGTSRGWEREERILLCAPLRDAAPHLPMFFSHLRNLTYPHRLIDLAFLVGDSKDNTTEMLSDLLAQLQASGAQDVSMPFGEISVIEKDFGQKVNQDVNSRHGFAAQASRRKSMAQARNWLLSAALRPTHSWVYWRDVDVETAPASILEDLMRHNADVIVPNVWRPLPDWLGGEQPYDLNSWQESETALELAKTLDEDAVIVEGYAEYATWRPHLAYLRDPYGDPNTEMDLDGVGGVSILAKAKVFRSGVHFPAFSFEKHAETEGFGKMAKRMQYSVIGLPHYTIWHLYEPSVDDMRHMEEMEAEQKKLAADSKSPKEGELLNSQFDVDKSQSQWEKDKDALQQAALKKEDANTVDQTVSKQDTNAEKGKSQWEKDAEAMRQEALAKLEKNAEKTAETKDAKVDDRSTEKTVEIGTGQDAGKETVPPNVAAAANVFAKAPFGNMIAHAEEKLKNRQQQLMQQQLNPPSGEGTSTKPPPDDAAGDLAQQGPGRDGEKKKQSEQL